MGLTEESVANQVVSVRGVAHQSAGLAEGCMTMECYPLEGVAEEGIWEELETVGVTEL